MQSISRRGFVISAAAAGAAFGLDGPLEFFTPAFAQKAAQDVVKFKVGDIEVIQMYDGIWEKAHDEKFIKNATLDETKAALKAGGLTDAHVPIPFTVTAIRTKGKLVLFDSGTGAQLAPTAGNITKNDVLEESRHRPGQGRHHRHHALPPRSHQRSDGQGHQRADLPQCRDLRAGGRVQVLDRSRRPRPAPPSASRPCSRPGRTSSSSRATRRSWPGVKPINTNGHTPGHTSYLIGSGNRQLIVLGDVTNIPALFVKNPGWHAVFDADGAQGRGEPPQDLRPRHRRQGDDHRLPLRHAGRRHDQEGRQGLRLRAGQGTATTSTVCSPPTASPRMPNAEILVPAAEWKYWSDDGEMAKAPAGSGLENNFKNIRRVFGALGNKVTQYEPDKELVPGITSVATYGHTPGHTSHRIASGCAPGHSAGRRDGARRRSCSRATPAGTRCSTMDGAMAEQTRRKLYDMLATDKMPAAGLPLPVPGDRLHREGRSGLSLGCRRREPMLGVTGAAHAWTAPIDERGAALDVRRLFAAGWW